MVLIFGFVDLFLRFVKFVPSFVFFFCLSIESGPTVVHPSPIRLDPLFFAVGGRSAILQPDRVGSVSG